MSANATDMDEAERRGTDISTARSGTGTYRAGRGIDRRDIHRQMRRVHVVGMEVLDSEVLPVFEGSGGVRNISTTRPGQPYTYA